MTISHHPNDATLMSFAAGSLPQAFAVVVASHIALCPRCQRELAMLEAFGGALIDTLGAASLKEPPPSVNQVPPDPAPVRHTPQQGQRPASAEGLPAPLRKFVGSELDAIRWRWLGPGIWGHDIALTGAGNDSLRLLKAAPGQAIPEHGHGGGELTLVLQGAYRDAIGEFGPGDVADLDVEVEHTPVAFGEADCICVIASEAPPRFRGWLPRLVRPLLRI